MVAAADKYMNLTADPPTAVAGYETVLGNKCRALGKGLHSFPFQLNLSSSIHRMTQSNPRMCPGVAQVEL